MKVKVSVVAIAGLLLFASTAGAHLLRFGDAKRAIAQKTASICAGADGLQVVVRQPV